MTFLTTSNVILQYSGAPYHIIPLLSVLIATLVEKKHQFMLFLRIQEITML